MGSHRTWAPNADGTAKDCFFRPVEKSPAQTPYCQKFVSIRATVVFVYDGALAEDHAASSTILAVVEVG